MNKKLSLYCITYNRRDYLKRVIDSFVNSPIKDIQFTILDNASTDGTSELIDNFTKTYRNIIHVRHKYNIGGCGNTCRAIELGLSSESDYFWVICDDDLYDFSNWNEVEKQINQGTDLICVCDYVFQDKIKDKNKIPLQLLQMTFLPSLIIKRSSVPISIISSLYDCIPFLFPHLCIPIYLINNNKKIHFLSKPIVQNGYVCDEVKADSSYFRGFNSSFCLDRKFFTVWPLGYAIILSLLSSKKLRTAALEAGIVDKNIHGSWRNFFDYSFIKYYFTDRLYLFDEIYSYLSPNIRRKWRRYYFFKMVQLFFIKIQIIGQMIFSVKTIKLNNRTIICINFMGGHFLFNK